jgi:Transglycosylase-like domain
MRQPIAIALTTLGLPAAALASSPYKDEDLKPTPVLDKALIAHQRAHHARRLAARAASAGEPVAIPSHLAAIAACESGGNPSAVGGGGLYRGAFQMTYSAWASVGGQGDPAAAPMSEQVRRAAALYAQAGPGQWPVCGQ